MCFFFLYEQFIAFDLINFAWSVTVFLFECSTEVITTKDTWKCSWKEGERQTKKRLQEKEM
jgi:hypothetical protein